MNKKCVIMRPLDGICLNTELETLLDAQGNEIIFESRESANKFLEDNGVDISSVYCYPELCNECKNNYKHSVSEAEEIFDFEKGNCKQYEMEIGDRV